MILKSLPAFDPTNPLANLRRSDLNASFHSQGLWGFLFGFLNILKYSDQKHSRNFPFKTFFHEEERQLPWKNISVLKLEAKELERKRK